jgi:hypothetical protein
MVPTCPGLYIWKIPANSINGTHSEGWKVLKAALGEECRRKAQERCISKIRPSEAARASRKLRDGGKLGYLEEDAAIGVVVIELAQYL